MGDILTQTTAAIVCILNVPVKADELEAWS